MFNVCDSVDAAALVSAGVASVVTCNGLVSDDVACLFTQSFYASLARRSVRQSFDDACATLAAHHPSIDHPYELHPAANTLPDPADG
ncbi:MAG: hypothetical protein ACRD0K_09940 [Egibacteraceae bacterium]